MDLDSHSYSSSNYELNKKLKNAEERRYELVEKLTESSSLFSAYEKLTYKYFKVNGIEYPKDPALFFNRKLTNLATSFMKKIQQDLIGICQHLNISFTEKPALPYNVYMEFKQQSFNYYISQSSNLVTIKCSNRNIFVDIDALKRSEYFRLDFDRAYNIEFLKIIPITE